MPKVEEKNTCTHASGTGCTRTLTGKSCCKAVASGMCDPPKVDRKKFAQIAQIAGMQGDVALAHLRISIAMGCAAWGR